MSKPTKAQMKVLTLMVNGWELGVETSINGSVWIQKNGLGRGGKTEKVHINTFNGLYTRRLIKEKKYGFPHSVWELTDIGRKLFESSL